jgi:hypothetical protein
MLDLVVGCALQFGLPRFPSKGMSRAESAAYDRADPGMLRPMTRSQKGVTRNRKPWQDASERSRRNPRAGASRMVLRMVVSVRLASMARGFTGASI